MIKVQLISHTNVDPLDLTSHAARACYQSKEPKMGQRIDVENRLFKVGHHTTLQHFFVTFFIEGISVGEVTMGLHLVSPFYNTDQRSGRYCSKFFLEPNFKSLENYIKKYWPDVGTQKRKKSLDFIKESVGIYHSNINKVTELAKEFLVKERPLIKKETVEQIAPKIAQEQLRVFIPVIFPTGLDFTVNLTALAAMNRVAWSPVMKKVTDQMVKAVLKEFKELKFLFDKKEQRQRDWSLKITKSKAAVAYQPKLRLLNVSGEKDLIVPKAKDMHPVDLLHFLPEVMENNTGEVETEVEISLATMAQDQRHRTIRRSQPVFTGKFYVPPLIKKADLAKQALQMNKKWLALSKILPITLVKNLAPYGAMVKYKKSGSFNAVAHEQAKRLCFCAQEEIYHLSLALQKAVEKKQGKRSKLLKLLEPPCLSHGHCVEGARYCGRNLRGMKRDDYFVKRIV